MLKYVLIGLLATMVAMPMMVEAGIVDDFLEFFGLGGAEAQESPQETVSYSPSSETHCSNGMCTKVLYIDRTFYFEDEWKRINSTFYYNGTHYIADGNNFKVYIQGNKIAIKGEDESEVYFTVPTTNQPSVSGNALTYDISTKGAVKVDATLKITVTSESVEKLITVNSLTTNQNSWKYSEEYNDTFSKSRFLLGQPKIWYEVSNSTDNWAVYYPIVWVKSGNSLEIAINKTWFDSATYPIYVDPTVIYNFTTANGNKAYGDSADGNGGTVVTKDGSGDFSDEDVPTFTEVFTRTVSNFTQNGYTALAASDNKLANLTSPGSNNEPFGRYNFTINQPSTTINWLWVTMEQREQVGAGSTEHCYYGIINFTNTDPFDFGAYMDGATDVTRSYNFTNNAEIQKLIDTNKQLVMINWGTLMDSGDGCDVNYVGVILNYNSTISFNSPTNNDTLARPNDPVNFTMSITTNDDDLSGYKFSSNFSDGTWRNSSWTALTGTQTTATIWNVSTSTTAGNYAWRFYANTSTGYENVSEIQSFTFATRVLSINWTVGSQINSTTCTEESPCDWTQYAIKNANATINCSTNPAGQSCGSVSAGIMHNDTATTWKMVNTTVDAEPMFINGSSIGDPDSNWYNATVSGSPPVRKRFAMTYIGNNKVMIFGGDSSTVSYYNDTWIYNLTDATWYNATKSGSPSVRQQVGNSMAYDSDNDVAILFGGYNGTAPGMNDIWLFFPNNESWSKRNPSVSPPARRWTNLVYVSKHQRMVMHGGYDGSYLSDTWIYNYSEDKWYDVTNTSCIPPIRFLDWMVYDSDSDRIIKFGGSTTVHFNDTWVFNYTDYCWYNVTNNAFMPGMYDSHSMAYDSESKLTILHGGTRWFPPPDLTTYSDNQTWAFNYTDLKWYNITSEFSTRPTRVNDHSMVYVPNSDKIVRFGGQNSLHLNETWVLNYTTGLISGPQNPSSLGTLNDAQSAQLNYTINATQAGTGNLYNMTFNVSSSYSQVAMNYTPTAFVCIGGGCVVTEDTIPPQFSNNATNGTIAGTPVNFTITITDGTGVSGYIFSTNNSGAWKNSSFKSTSGSPITAWNVTVLNSTVGSLIQWKYYANDSSTNGNWNASQTYNLTTVYNPYLTGCSNLNQAGATYYLAEDIINSSNAKCMDIQADNVILDCQGHLLDANYTHNTWYAIWLDRNQDSSVISNFTLKNCIITDWAEDVIRINGGSNNTIENCSFDNKGATIWVSYSNSNNVTNININDCEGFEGVRFSYSNFSSVTNLNISNCDFSLDLVSVSFFTVKNINVTNGVEGVWLQYFYNSTMDNVNITNTSYPFFLLYVDYNIFSNITVKSSPDLAFYLTQSNDNIFTDMIIQDSKDYGIQFSDNVGNNIPNRFYNNLFNNTINFYTTSQLYLNYWNTTHQTGTRIYSSGTNIGGNYWTNSTNNGYSDTCTDADCDGFCDDAYTLATDNVDYLPYSDEWVDGGCVNISFTVNFTGYQTYASSLDGTQMASAEFNTSQPDQPYTNASIVVDVNYKQNDFIPMLNVTNIGNTNVRINISINESLPASMVLFGTYNNNPFTNPNVINASGWIANTSMSPNTNQQYWIFTNFTSAAAGTTQRVLFINSSEV